MWHCKTFMQIILLTADRESLASPDQLMNCYVLIPSGKPRSWGRGRSKIFELGVKMLITFTCIKELRKKSKIR
jgi:hypothetical protein